MFDSTDQDLCTITKILEMWNISTESMRELDYDNGANMKGEMSFKVCFHKAILKPFFMPCSAHMLNLISNDISKVNSDMISFFFPL